MRQHYLSRGFNFVVLTTAMLMLIYSYIQLFEEKYYPSISSELPLIGKIVGHNNTVKLKKAHLFSWLDVENTQKVNAEDLIFTYKLASSVVMLGEDKTIKIYPETMIQLNSADQLSLKKGSAEFDFKKKNSKLIIFLGNRKVTLKSDNAKVIIDKSEGQGSIRVQSGSIEVNTQDKTYDVNSEEKITVSDDMVEVSAVSLELLSPVNKIFKINSAKSDIKFNFIAPNENSTTLAISSNKEFSKLVIQKDAVQPQTSVSLPKGEYFWRISQNALTGQSARFEIISIIKAPATISPVKDFELQTYEDAAQVDFEWTSLPEIQLYQIEIYDSSNNQVLSEIVNKNQYTWTTKTFGDFNWKIRAMGDFVEGIWGQDQNFSIKKGIYTEEKPMVIELQRPNQKVTFNWDENPKNSDSVFTLSRDEDFKNVIRELKVKSNSTSIVFPETGKYYWKVNTFGSNQKVRPRTIVIKPTPPPEKPQRLPNLKLKIKTKNQTSFNLFNWLIPTAHASEQGHVDLTWPKIEDAAFYEIEIYTDKNLKNRILKIPSKDNSHQWQMPRAGKFYWRYRYKDYWGRYSPFSDSSELIIDPGKITNITPPTKKEIIKPKPSPAKILVVEKKSIPKIQDYRYWSSLSFAPSQLEFAQVSSDRYQIEGSALGGYGLAFGSKYNGRHNFSAKYDVTSGIVFEDQDFLNRTISGIYHYHLSSMKINFGALLNQISSYETTDSTATFASMITSYSAFAGLSYKLEFIPLMVEASYHFGSYTGLLFKLSYERSFWDRYQWVIAGSYLNSEIDNEDAKIDITASKLDLGLKYLF